VSAAKKHVLARLLDAALSLFASKGYSATKVEDVAASAGVSKGTLFFTSPAKKTCSKR
jgi:AcrR family transcriptional regulator